VGQSEVILLDTHVVLWLAFEDARISRKGRAAIEEARKSGDGLAISDISLLEIASLERKNRITLRSTLEAFLTEIENRFVVFPISARVCVRAMRFPAGYPSDPADRVIGATALVNGISLVTADDAIRRSRVVPIIW
jgi:PIN domain nuclease of toxin-antitoxin system